MRLALLLLLVPAFAHAEVVVRVALEAQVDGPAITLGDVASIEGAASSELAELAALPLGDAAPPARARALPRAVFERALARLPLETVLEAPRESRVTTKHREITPAWLKPRLERALAHRLKWPDAQVAFEAWHLPEPFAVSTRATRLRVQFRPDEDFLGPITLAVELSDPTGTAREIRRSATVHARVEAPVVVAVRALRRGHVLEPADLTLEARLLDPLPRDVVRSPRQAIGQPLAQRVGAGAPLFASQLATRPVVRRGDPIVVLAESNGLTLRMQARALEAGAIGQTIRVENPASRRRFRAQVTGSGNARLGLSAVGSGR